MTMRHHCLMILVTVWPALALAQAAGSGQTAWVFSDGVSRDGDKRLISATAEGSIDGRPASLMIACIGGKPAVTLQAPSSWDVRLFRYQFDEAPARAVVDEIKTKDRVMVAEGRSARGFVRAAAQAKSVLVTYAATPESRAVRYDLAGFQEGARGLLNACEDALK